MKKLIPALLCVLLLCSCSKIYTYTFSMSYPTVNQTPQYENDTLSISFEPAVDGIGMKVFNKTAQGLKIEWDEMSMAIDGKAYRVLHGQATAANITIAQPPSTVPPKSLLNDKVFPVNNLASIKISGQIYTVLRELFPISDYGNKRNREKIMSRKGTRLVVYMPYYLDNKLVSSYYNIEIADVRMK